MANGEEKKELQTTNIAAVTSIPKAALRAQLHNDWSQVGEEDRLKYILGICKALNIPTPLNPFRFIKMREKEVLYAPNEAAQLLADRNKISATITNKYLDREQNIYVVEIRATIPPGRTIDNIGCLSMAGLTGQNRANAMMKCVTKAMRRTIFNAVGLSVMDEDDLESIREFNYPIPPPATTGQILPPVSQDSVVDDADEIKELKAKLFSRLVGKKAKFEGKVSNARHWILEFSGKAFEKLTASDCVDLLALLDDEEEMIEERSQKQEVQQPKEMK